jgi:hypothetical protein
MSKSAQKIIAQALKELAGGGFMPQYKPTWHPYYWLGRLHAAKEVIVDDGVRRRNRKPSTDRPAR